MQYEIFIIVFLLLLIPLLNNRSRLYLNIINKRRKRGKQNMPTAVSYTHLGDKSTFAVYTGADIGKTVIIGKRTVRAGYFILNA